MKISKSHIFLISILILFFGFLIFTFIYFDNLVGENTSDSLKIRSVENYIDTFIGLFFMFCFIGLIFTYYYYLVRFINFLSGEILVLFVAIGFLSLVFNDGFRSVFIGPLNFSSNQVINKYVSNFPSNNSYGLDSGRYKSNSGVVPVEQGNSPYSETTNLSVSQSNNLAFSSGTPSETENTETSRINISSLIINNSYILSFKWFHIFITTVISFFSDTFIYESENLFLALLILIFAAKLVQWVMMNKDFLVNYLIENKTNLVFTGIFSLGAFLSISSIIAVPVLKGDKQFEELDSKALETSLDKIIINNSSAELSLDLPTIRYDKLIFRLEAISDSLNNLDWSRTLLKNSSYNIGYIKNQLLSTKDFYLNNEENFKKAKNNIPSFLKSKRGELIEIFNTALIKKNIDNERIELFTRINNAFRNIVKGSKSTLSIGIERMKSDYDLNENELNYLDEFLLKDISMLIDEKEVDFYLYYDKSVTWNYERDNYYSSDYIISSYANSKDIFRKIAYWLIISKSNEMILIVGMLGFGLLGAGISALVRKRDYSAQDSMFSSTITSTLIGGVSASLVIFLSAKGGVAIFSNADINLNPYTLLFLCLIGSVYSEVIWERVKGQVTSGIAIPNPSPNPPPPPIPPAPPNPPASPSPITPIVQSKPKSPKS